MSQNIQGNVKRSGTELTEPSGKIGVKTFKISVKGSGTEPKEPPGKVCDKNIQDSVKVVEQN